MAASMRRKISDTVHRHRPSRKTTIKIMAVYETKKYGHRPSRKTTIKIMAVYETKNDEHGLTRKSIIKIIAVYETKLTDHINFGPHIRFTNLVLTVAANRFANPVGAAPLW
jgi:hypothetical protein